MARLTFDDTALKSKILVELGVEGIERDNVTVECDNGHVHISGTVADESLREKARRAAMKLPGVKNVTLDLEVQP